LFWAILFFVITAGMTTIENSLLTVGYAQLYKIVLQSLIPALIVAGWLWLLNRLEGILAFITMVSGGTAVILISAVLV